MCVCEKVEVMTRSVRRDEIGSDLRLCSKIATLFIVIIISLQLYTGSALNTFIGRHIITPREIGRRCHC